MEEEKDADEGVQDAQIVLYSSGFFYIVIFGKDCS